MPNRDEHLRLALPIGGATALAYAHRQPPIVAAIEAVAGVVGAHVGSKFPDIIDPPTNPNHRAIGHSVLGNLLALAGAVAALPEAQSWLRYQADQAAQRGDSNVALFCHLVAGFMPGFAAGHVTHLAQDSQTPAGLPWTF